MPDQGQRLVVGERGRDSNVQRDQTQQRGLHPVLGDGGAADLGGQDRVLGNEVDGHLVDGLTGPAPGEGEVERLGGLRPWLARYSGPDGRQ